LAGFVRWRDTTLVGISNAFIDGRQSFVVFVILCWNRTF
jgi:hypothetical protein